MIATDIKLIAITGGIGSGKSVISSILRNLSFPVYDCDQQAKWLMTQSQIIRHRMTSLFGNEIYLDNGEINKKLLSHIIFNDATALEKVNNIVHPVVKDDILNWHHSMKGKIHFVETAILTQAKMESMVDEVWVVTAPLSMRITRVMNRDNATSEQVLARINSQVDIADDLPIPVKTIVNDGNHAIMPQVFNLLQSLST